MNGVQITTSQLGLFTVSVSFSSLANAKPSCRFIFIFQLPATIFFLIFIFFLKSLLYNLFDCSLSLIQRLQAHILSAIESRIKGNKYHKKIFDIFVIVLATCGFEMASSSKLPFNSSSLGKSL